MAAIVYFAGVGQVDSDDMAQVLLSVNVQVGADAVLETPSHGLYLAL